MTPWFLMSLACAPAESSGDGETVAEGDALARQMMDARRWYRDADRDGFGDPATSRLAPTKPRGHVANHRDCLDEGDDAAATSRGAAYFEFGQDCKTDADGDGFGSMDPTGGVTAGLDCDDGDASTWCVDERSVGNDVEFDNGSSHAPNYLLGTALDVPHPLVASAFALISKSASANVKMALYTDEDGDPGTLVVATGSHAVPVGVLEIPVDPTPLPPGTYWIMAVYEEDASPGSVTTLTSVVKYRSLDFADPIPHEFGTPTTYTGRLFNYSLIGY